MAELPDRNSYLTTKVRSREEYFNYHKGRAYSENYSMSNE